ncbi:MAG: DUF3018 family protein [Nitrosomonas sp.]|nr:DUF3018 family protein [Nitrosomonas sp.]
MAIFDAVMLFTAVERSELAPGTSDEQKGCNNLFAAWGETHMETTHVNARVKKHRDTTTHGGLRPVQIWVPDTRRRILQKKNAAASAFS